MSHGVVRMGLAEIGLGSVLSKKSQDAFRPGSVVHALSYFGAGCLLELPFATSTCRHPLDGEVGRGLTPVLSFLVS